MKAYLLALEIEPFEVGKTYASLPLHCTLVHWFWLDMASAELTAHLQNAAKGFKPVHILAQDTAIFTGHTKQGTVPVTVNTVEYTPDLHELHTKMCTTLDRLSVRYQAPEYVKKGFAPHVTRTAQSQLSRGEKHLSTALYLVEADAPEYGNERRVCSKIPLA